MAEAQAYLDEQGLPAMLNACLNQVVKERAPNAGARFAELLAKAARDKDSSERMRTLFAQADTSGNGFIDIDEFLVLKRHRCVNEFLTQHLTQGDGGRGGGGLKHMRERIP